jgi:hypothetical protein
VVKKYPTAYLRTKKQKGVTESNSNKQPIRII